MKKYTPVFGDQSLFDGAPEDAVAVRVNDCKSITYYFLTEEHLALTNSRELKAIPVIAMRRIIKAPTWTVEDQKAGKLPEVGCLVREKLTHDRCGYYCIVIGVDDGTYCIQFDDGSMRFDDINGIEPIETPAEKAQRERAEWAKQASQFIDDELDCVNLVGEHVMRRFYNAMLSGDLPVPGKDGE